MVCSRNQSRGHCAMKKILKGIVQAISLACAFPFALLSLFGRIEPLYLIGAECFALLPGLPGDYVRIAYYRLTLEKCALESRIQFGSFFAHPRAAVGRDVYIGGYCVLGCTSIGDRTHLASGVQILSGRHQHGRDSAGNLLGANQSAFETVLIGSDCWIGAGAIVMADVGPGTTIGAGAIVSKPIPPGTVAVGNPARVIKTIDDQVR
jgi:virginiamycin A acetyltransferase